MTTIVYTGPFTGLDVAAAAGDVHLEHGVPTEVPDDLAAQLVDQDPDIDVVDVDTGPRRRRRPSAVEAEPT